MVVRIVQTEKIVEIQSLSDALMVFSGAVGGIIKRLEEISMGFVDISWEMELLLPFSRCVFNRNWYLSSEGRWR